MKHSREQAVLGAGLAVRGRVHGAGDLRVEAQVEGDITVQGALTIDHNAQVQGALDATSIVVGGTLTGDLRASGEVAIQASAQVQGDVYASALSIEEGAQFVGRVDAAFELPAAIA